MSVDKKMALRHTFVGMLFALALAQAATLFGDLFSVITSDWDYRMSLSGLLERLMTENNILLAPAAHLFLGIFLIAISWVGWSRSGAAGNKINIDDTMGYAFLLLIIELILLILYFILISSVELDIDSFQENKLLSDAIPNPSAAPEATLIFMIFIVYVIWDLVSDVILSPIEDENLPFQNHKRLSKTLVFLTGIFTYCLVSIVCTVIAYFIQSEAITATKPNSVVFIDLTLLSLLYFFRTAKPYERLIIDELPWEKNRAGAIKTNNKDAYKKMYTIAIPILFMYVFSNLA